jgi:hypothetical protein
MDAAYIVSIRILDEGKCIVSDLVDELDVLMF